MFELEVSLASRHAVLQFHGHRSIWCNLGRSSSFPPEKTSTLLSIMKILLEEDGRRPETKKPGSTRNCSFDLLSVPHVVHRFVCRISIAILEQIGSTFQDPPGQAVWRPDHRWFLDTCCHQETPVGGCCYQPFVEGTSRTCRSAAASTEVVFEPVLLLFTSDDGTGFGHVASATWLRPSSLGFRSPTH